MKTLILFAAVGWMILSPQPVKAKDHDDDHAANIGEMMTMRIATAIAATATSASGTSIFA
jgi:hypothetical protein